MLKKILLLIISVSSLFAMHSAELNINKYDLEADLKLDMGQFNEAVEPDTTFVGIGYIKAGGENASYTNVDGYTNISFMIKQDIKNTGFKVGLGVKAVYTSYLKADFVATPIGAELGYSLPINFAIPLGVNGSVYYAPNSLSFSEAGRYLEYRAEVYAKLLDRAAIYVGYRKIDTKYDFDNKILDYTYNKSAYFGFRFSF